MANMIISTHSDNANLLKLIIFIGCIYLFSTVLSISRMHLVQELVNSKEYDKDRRRSQGDILHIGMYCFVQYTDKRYSYIYGS